MKIKFTSSRAISLGARYILKRLGLFEASSRYIECPVKLLIEGNNFEVISSKYTSGSIVVCQSWRNIINFAVIEHFFEFGTLEERRNYLPGPSYTKTTEEKVVEVEEYFKINPNSSTCKAA